MRNIAFIAGVMLVTVLFIGLLNAVRAQVPPLTVLASPVATATATAAAAARQSPGFAIPKSSGTPLYVACGVIAENPIKTGQGSGPDTFELRSLAGEHVVLLGWPSGVPLPAIGSYMCGRFIGGAPKSGLTAFVRSGDPDYVPPTYVNKTYKFSVVLPEPYRRSAKLSFANTGGRPVAQDAFTARTDADEAVVAGASCETACPIWNYVAVVAVFPSTQSETPRQWYAAFGGATGQVIEDTTVDRRVAIRVTNGVPYATELVVKDGDRIFLVAYSIRSDMATPAGASKDELDAILALFRFVP